MNLTAKFYRIFRKNIQAVTLSALRALIIAFCFFSTKPLYAETKVILLGIDSADWKALGHFINKGKASNFKTFIKRGTRAHVNPEDNKDAPVNWTTVATGFKSEKHDIQFLNYYDSAEQRATPYLSTQRKKPAFWNILTENGITTGIVGWPVSWPAEAVNGFFVSAYEYFDDETGDMFPRAFYVNGDQMFYPLTLKSTLENIAHLQEMKYKDNIRMITQASVSKSERSPIKTTLWDFLTDDINQKIGQELYQEIKPRVLAVYLEGLHRIGHNLLSEEEDTRREHMEIYEDVLGNYYSYLDGILGEYIQLADEETTIIVVSDRGLNQRGQHTADGIFIIAGPAIKRDAKSFFTISLDDIAPTILYLMGVSVSADMDGRVFRFAFKREYLAAHPVETVETFKEYVPLASPAKKPVARKDIVERTKILEQVEN